MRPRICLLQLLLANNCASPKALSEMRWAGCGLKSSLGSNILEFVLIAHFSSGSNLPIVSFLSVARGALSRTDRAGANGSASAGSVIVRIEDKSQTQNDQNRCCP